MAEITEAYVLKKFKEILDDSEASWAIKVKALELLGKYLGMFVDRKQVQFDIRSLMVTADDRVLRTLANGEIKNELLGESGIHNPDNFDVRDYSGGRLSISGDQTDERGHKGNSGEGVPAVPNSGCRTKIHRRAIKEAGQSTGGTGEAAASDSREGPTAPGSGTPDSGTGEVASKD
jgi:hypothetical protein